MGSDMTWGSTGEVVMIPLDNPSLRVRVVVLFKGKEPGPFAFLQGMRSGVLMRLNPDPEKTEVAKGYRRKEKCYQKMLADKVPADFDAVVSPPSRMAWQAEPYRQVLCHKNPSAIDLTPQLTSTGKSFAGENATVNQIATQMQFLETGQESKIRRLIIVDDTFTKGTTAAAIIGVLRTHGLSEDCEIIIACPLWLDTFSPKSDDAIKERD